MKKRMTAIIIAATLSAGSFVVGASFARDIGKEVLLGTILTANHRESEFPNLSRISYARAIETALRAINGKLLDIGLEEENGFLVWGVEVVDSRGMESVVKIDAGDGRVLVVREVKEEDKDNDNDEECDEEQAGHSRWKFWEKDKEE